MKGSLTGYQIADDIIRLLKGTPVASEAKGGIYHGGQRPRDSQKEDIVVIYTTADAAQFQKGVVTVNVYVPDIRNSHRGVLVTDVRRCGELEAALRSSVDSLTADKSGYLFSLREAVHTQRDDNIQQSFVVAHIGFKHYK